MYFQRINRTDPEKVFVVVKSAYTTGSLAAGNAVCFVYNGTDDGLAVTQPVTATLNLLAGIMVEAVANGGYGLCQVYGHNTLASVSGTTDVAVGSKLTAINAAFHLKNANSTTVAAESGLVIGGQAYTSAAPAVKKVFIRCM